MSRFFSIKRRNAPDAKILFATNAVSDERRAIAPIEARASLISREAHKEQHMRNRVWLCLCVFVIIFSGLSVRLAGLSLFEDRAGVEYAALTEVASESVRPNIVDRNGKFIAMNQSVTGAGVITKNIWDAERTAEKLISVFPKHDKEQLKSRLESSQYIVLSNDLKSEQKSQLVQLGLPGVEFFENVKRIYPKGSLAAHAIGYTIPGKGGVAGLEYQIDESAYKEKLVSSLDVRAQQVLEEELYGTLTEFNASAAWGVLMDVTTGEVLALANLPTYNPNEPNLSEPAHWRNRAMYDVYELGSAFKILTAAMAIEEQTSNPNKVYDVRHPISVQGKRITDYKPKGGYMSLTEVIQYSSNIGMAQIALELGTDKQKEYLSKLGLTTSLITELSEKRTPMLPAQWKDIETATISYGHGIAVTPLQLTAAVAATINGGYYIQPTFNKRQATVTGEQIFSDYTSAQLRLILRRVVTDGTAKSSEADGYYIIGKTATADKPSPYGGYKKDQRLSSFVGAFPGYDPKYVLLVSFDEPQPTEKTYGYATAGIVAAPAFKRIVDRIGPILNVPTVTDERAFAQFMSPLKAKAEMRLAMNDIANVPAPASVGADEIATLLLELGP